MLQTLHSTRATWRITIDGPAGAAPFNQAERRFVQRVMPGLCARGGWTLRCCAAGPHAVAVLADVDPAQEGDKVRRQIERWLTQSLNERFERRTWWADAGRASRLSDPDALNQAYPDILGQRA